MSTVNQQKKFGKDSLVWAKVRGYPWWPGIIGKVDENVDVSGNISYDYTVNFIGDNSHAKLNKSQLCNYEEKLEEFGANAKQKKLKNSIGIANKILKGKTTYKNEVKKIEQKKLQRRFSGNAIESNEQSSFSPEPEPIPIQQRNSSNIIKRTTRVSKKQVECSSGKHETASSILAEVTNLAIKKFQTNQDYDISKSNIDWRKSSSNEDQDQKSLSRMNELDMDFNDLIFWLMQQQMNHEKIQEKLKHVNINIKFYLNKILEHINQQLNSSSLIQELIQGNQGKLLNAIYIILKGRIQRSPDHFFQRETSITLEELRLVLSKLKQKLIDFYFDPQSIITNLPKSFGDKCNKNKSKFKVKLLQDKLKSSKTLNIEEEVEQNLSEISQGESESDEDLGQFPKKRNTKRILAIKKSKTYKAERKKNSQSTNLETVCKNRPNDEQKIDGEQEELEQDTHLTTQKELNQQIYEKQQLQRQLEQYTDNTKQYADKQLRKKVCYKILKILQDEYQLNRDTSQQITLKLEQFARLRDQQMKRNYKDEVYTIISNLQKSTIPQIKLVKWIECHNSSDSEKFWAEFVQRS